jgi:copper(I)-binding protein
MSPMSAENGAIYMDITASEDDALVGADVGMDTAMMTQIHETTMNADGTMGMSEVESIVLPAGSMVSLAPGGYHIMLMGLKQPLALGDTVAVTLTFESGDELVVAAEVREEAP